MQRRSFLLSSAGLLLQAKQSAIQFPVSPRQRLSVASYPFRSGFSSLNEFARSVPKEFEVNGIEPWARHFKSVEPDYIHSLHQSFEEAKVHVVNIPVDIASHPCSSDTKEQQNALVQYRSWIDAAVILKSPGIRVHVPTGAKHSADLPCAIDILKKVAAYGASKGIVVSLENDDPHSENPDTIVKVIEGVGSRNLRALPDFCNSMLISNDPEYNRRGLKALFAHAYTISHVKDSEVDNGKVYRVDTAEIFAIAKAANYRGYFSMEWEGASDPYAGTRSLLAQSLKALQSG